MTLCKFCNQKKAVKKSHIIPEFMYKHTYDDLHKMVVADVALDELGERQKGYYEPIICIDCEHYFNINFEMPCVSFIKKVPINSKIGSIVNFSFNPNLELLLLSILWRASHAYGVHWQEVDLGPHEEVIKKCLETKNANSNYSFWVHLVAHDNGEIEKGIVSSVQRLKVNGHNLYHFIASGVQFVIKISAHKLFNITPAPLEFDQEINAKVYGIKDAPSMHIIFNKK